MGCSPIKAVRELGSERRETVRSLSGVGVGYLRGAVLSTRGPGCTVPGCLIQKMNDKLVEHKQYIAEYGQDIEEVRNWEWHTPEHK